MTPEHGLVDEVLFVLSPSSYALWTVYEMADPESSDGCNSLVCCFRTTFRRHCGLLSRQQLSILVLTLWRRYLFFLCLVEFLSLFEQVGSWNYLLLCGIRFLC